MDRAQVQASRFLSLVLRHKPEAAGVSLDDAGWCEIESLLKGCALHGHSISSAELDAIVAENDKKRFEFSDDRRRIRARQGHSIDVDLKYEPHNPPQILYHGTATRFLDSIRQIGLIKGSRLLSICRVLRKQHSRLGKGMADPLSFP